MCQEKCSIRRAADQVLRQIGFHSGISRRHFFIFVRKLDLLLTENILWLFGQARGGKTSHQVLRDILMEVQISHIPPTLLKNWALEIYKTPTDYWTFRKMVSAEHVF